MSDLRQCAHCGGDAEYIYELNDYGDPIVNTAHIECRICGSSMDCGIEEASIAGWNSRASDAQAEKLAWLLRSGIEYRCPPRGPHEEMHYQEVDAAIAAYDASKETK